MGPLQGLISAAFPDRAAFLDLGTNTFHLLIARRNSVRSWEPLHIARRTVKLGKGGLGNNIITPDAFQRGLEAIDAFSDVIRNHQVSGVHALATSAIRSTVNGQEFIRQVKKRTGIVIRPIRGTTEAGLILEGVRQTLPDTLSRFLVMDIGGGSTEFVIADKHRTFWKKSFPVGASRLREQFLPSDPISREDLRLINLHLKRILSPLTAALLEYPVSILIGSSGSFETFSKMIAAETDKKEPSIDSVFFRLSKSSLDSLHRKLVKSDAIDRRHMKGLVSMRVDMIVIASILTRFVIDQAAISGIFASTFALKEGAAARWARTGRI